MRTKKQAASGNREIKMNSVYAPCITMRGSLRERELEKIECLISLWLEQRDSEKFRDFSDWALSGNGERHDKLRFAAVSRRTLSIDAVRTAACMAGRRLSVCHVLILVTSR